jgi:hypothetical protein
MIDAQKAEKSYSGPMMQAGMRNEEILLNWLKKTARSILDFREFRLSQKIDVDFGIETIDGNYVLAEIKSDKWIKEEGNLCFEVHRINHFAKDHWFYLGWGWRSPAQKLIIRNPETGETFVFDFSELRTEIGRYVSRLGKNLRIAIVPTDKQKTTFNWLIPMRELKGKFKKFLVHAA